MTHKKWIWTILLFLGSAPFLVAFGYCFVNSVLDAGGLLKMLLKMSFVDYLFGYSFLYWPTYIVGIILIRLSVVKLKKKH